MSRSIIYMAAFGLIALIAVTFAFLRGGPSLDPGKPIGNTAISHGGPAPAPTEVGSPAHAAAPIALGDRVVIGTAPGPGGGLPAPVALLAAVPESEPPEPPATTETVTSVIPGTVGIVVAIAPAVPPDTRQKETYYKVQLPNGLAGWVPERTVHVAAHQAGEEAPR